LEVALNRRGVFFKKLAASDLEFFEARAAGLPTRGLLLSINAPIAEAVLPRAAQRRGYWKIEGRQHPAGAAEPFELHRAVDWQLSGSGTDDAVPPVAAGDWLAVQYETADDGRVSFLWRVITRAKHRGQWGDVEGAVNRHLVSRMAHFADVHPEHEAIEHLLGQPDVAEEDEDLFAAEEESFREHAPLPTESGDFGESTLRQSDGAIVQYVYYEPYAPPAPARLPPPPPVREPLPAANDPPLPKIDSLLNLAKALQPIVVKEIPAARQWEEAQRAPERLDAAPAPVAVAPVTVVPAAAGKSHWLRTASASVLGILLLAALGAKNTDTIAGLACERLGVHCVPREVIAGLRLPVAPRARQPHRRGPKSRRRPRAFRLRPSRKLLPAPRRYRQQRKGPTSTRLSGASLRTRAARIN